MRVELASEESGLAQEISKADPSSSNAATHSVHGELVGVILKRMFYDVRGAHQLALEPAANPSNGMAQEGASSE